MFRGLLCGMTTPDFDVIIVGAGLSGIGAAYHLQARCPDKSYAILEGREAIGGTWDLFRYPGIRSDSDMHTLGYDFKPWKARKAIADGSSILSYVRETAAENGIDRHIRFNSLVQEASWDSEAAVWTLTILDRTTGQTSDLTCRMLHMCAGYYSYEGGYKPDFPGENSFAGRVIHPQAWPEDLDYAGKKVVVIGSGATAVTLVPEMAKTAAHVTMLQRSPTYIVSRPAEDRIALGLRKILPEKLAYGLTRWKNTLLQMLFFRMARRRPDKVKDRIIGMAREELGEGHDIETHFTPDYNPWDQRLCLVPDGDLFTALREGDATITTDTIETFTPAGIKLSSGQELEADIVVSATGLQLEFMGGAVLKVDGARIDPASLHGYRGIMFTNVPNLVVTFGYTNASWTLKADLIAKYVTRLLKHMDKTGAVEVRPIPESDPGDAPWLDFSSGYVTRALHKLPRQGTSAPWKLNQNYIQDIFEIRHAPLDDGVLQYRRAGDPYFSDKHADAAAAIAAE